MTVEDWAVSIADLARVVENNHLGGEVRHSGGGLVLGVRGDVSSLDVLDRDVLDVEANIVTWFGLWEGFVVHFNRLDFSGELGWSESNNHT